VNAMRHSTVLRHSASNTLSRRDQSGDFVDHVKDEEFIARCARGDRSAMDVLVYRYHGKLIEFALRHVGDRDTAADIAQTVLVRVFRFAGSFRGQSSFKTWLYSIALSTIREQFRKQRTRKESMLSDAESDEIAASLAAQEASPEDTALDNICSRAMWEAVEELPERQRMAIILKFRNGLSYDEIAGVMNAPAGTVKSWVHYGLVSLRGALTPANCGGEP
jgi:RNA polymerase sigma-70 factor, ECF subfamily